MLMLLVICLSYLLISGGGVLAHCYVQLLFILLVWLDQEAQLTIGKFSDAGHGACGFEVGLWLHQACPVSHVFSWPSSFAL